MDQVDIVDFLLEHDGVLDATTSLENSWSQGHNRHLALDSSAP